MDYYELNLAALSRIPSLRSSIAESRSLVAPSYPAASGNFAMLCTGHGYYLYMLFYSLIIISVSVNPR